MDGGTGDKEIGEKRGDGGLALLLKIMPKGLAEGVEERGCWDFGGPARAGDSICVMVSGRVTG